MKPGKTSGTGQDKRKKGKTRLPELDKTRGRRARQDLRNWTRGKGANKTSGTGQDKRKKGKTRPPGLDKRRKDKTRLPEQDKRKKGKTRVPGTRQDKSLRCDRQAAD